MNKHTKWALVFALVLILFNIISFVIPFVRTTTFWIGYIFATLAVIISLFVDVVTSSSSKPVKSRFYGWPLVYISSIYVIVQLIISLICMGFSSIPVWIAIVVNMFCLCIALIGLIGTSATTDTIQGMDATVQQKVFFIRSLQADVDRIASVCNDEETRKALLRLSEAIRYSDPMSHDSLSSVEDQIQAACGELSRLVNEGQNEQARLLCNNILELLKQRNQQCLLLK